MLSLQHVSRSFDAPDGSVRALRDVSLDVAAHELLAVTGPSGSGKTTLLNIASLLDRPDQGRVVLGGVDVTALSEAGRSRLRAERLACVYQRYHLLPHRSALQNVMFRFRYTDTPARDAYSASMCALERVGLAHCHARRARVLSGGEQQRVAIARAIAAAPEVLLADEPTGNLDADAAGQIVSILKGLAEDGVAVLVVTHDARVRTWCTRQIALNAGARGRVETAHA